MWTQETTESVPNYVSEAMAEMHGQTLTTIASNCAPSPSAPTLISVVRDEIDRLPDFLRHYREAGISCFAFIDNGSTDGTSEYLSQQRDVILYATDRPFVWQRKQGWIMLALMMLGRGRNTWFLYADADELIVYDGYPQKTFGDLCKKMEEQKIRRARGMLVDMYADAPLLQSEYCSHSRLIDAYPYFDAGGYKEEKYIEIISRKGGPRQRVFGHIDKAFRPEMTKYPLFQITDNETFANPHHIWPYESNFISPCYIGILHFKFLPNISARIERNLAEKSYWGGSLEYQCYDTVLRKDRKLSLMSNDSKRYDSPQSLIDASLINPINF